jgi:hypothetical protein
VHTSIIRLFRNFTASARGARTGRATSADSSGDGPGAMRTSATKKATMILVLYCLLHFVLVSSIVLFIYFCGRIVLEDDDLMERLLRVLMAVAGALITLILHISGVTLAESLVDALSNASPLALTAGAAAPAGGGVAVGWYLMRIFPRSPNIAKRITVFVGIIGLLEFILVYGQSIAKQGLSLGYAAFPDVAFIVGLILYMGLTYKAKSESSNAAADGRFIR